jgi:hypothetical protein
VDCIYHILSHNRVNSSGGNGVTGFTWTLWVGEGGKHGEFGSLGVNTDEGAVGRHSQQYGLLYGKSDEGKEQHH